MRKFALLLLGGALWFSAPFVAQANTGGVSSVHIASTQLSRQMEKEERPQRRVDLTRKLQTELPAHGMVSEDIPAVLSPSDAHLYKKMFKLQRNRQRSQVAKLLKQLDDRGTLMGHLIAIRLLHPYTKTPYTDLKDWLARYSDHAPAPQVYQLANKKRPRKTNMGWHKRPDVMKASIAKYSDPDSKKKRSASVQKTKAYSKLLRKLRYYRIKKYYTKAMKVLAEPKTHKILGEDVWLQAASKLSESMLYNGEDVKAERMAREVYAKGGPAESKALWIAAFAAYRQGRVESAVGLFRKLAYSVNRNSKYFSQSAWWAAKGYEELEKDSMARVFLNLAAQDPYSFYGQLALEKLGKSKEGSWKEPRIKEKDAKFLLKDPVIRRVIALTQIGEHGLAQQELKLIHERVPYGMDESLLALALQLDLPNAALAFSRNLREQNKVYLSGLYPKINKSWYPKGGYTADEALMLAIMRQESAFNPYVVSRAGARGLMQLMPNTAKFIRRKVKKPVYSRPALLNPAINTNLGQTYLSHLDEQLDSNLLYIIAGYNAGPGSVRKWIKKGMAERDPLLFVESIPFPETRKYVKHVMGNLWMYRHRHQENTPGLSAMAQNLWPVKVANLSDAPYRTAKNER